LLKDAPILLLTKPPGTRRAERTRRAAGPGRTDARPHHAVIAHRLATCSRRTGSW
jgi:hypothetical protein